MTMIQRSNNSFCNSKNDHLQERVKMKSSPANLMKNNAF